MRLSRRERFLVTVLILLLLWTGFYKLWAGPEMFRILWEWEEGKDLEIRVRAKGTGNKLPHTEAGCAGGRQFPL